jgi:phosphocarrier protein FPr
LTAPVSGPVVAIESVPDPVFAQKIVGPGIAIDPIDQTLLAPCEGTIVQIHRAGHAVTIAPRDSGARILLHIGLDTVKLNGEGFTPKVRAGDKVRQGQPLIEFDADLIGRRAKSLLTLMVVTEVEPSRVTASSTLAAATAGNDVLLTVAPEREIKTGSNSATSVAHSSQEIKINLPTGLHARPAARLVAAAKAFPATIRVVKNGHEADAKSLVAMMALEIGLGDHVRFTAEGPEAERAVKELARFLRELKDDPAPAPATAKAAPLSASAPSSDPNLLRGVAVSPGIAIGRVHQVRGEKFDLQEKSTLTPAEENAALDRALGAAATDLNAVIDQVRARTDAARAAIFAAHRELLEDPALLTDARRGIAGGQSAAFAWNEAITQHAARLAALNNELLAGRANDLRDVGRRVLRHLQAPLDAPNASLASAGEAILIAGNLTPSETVQLDREKIFGFCTTSGGATSHVAILARSLGLPALAGVDPRVLDLADGTEVILDGDRGELRLNPSTEARELARERQSAQSRRREEALVSAHQTASTRDGRRVEVVANIGGPADARQAVETGADGVGLLRSEFLFLERATAPDEDEQHGVYQEIADILGPRPLIIRTLDVGGDKPLKYLPLEAEENPFLGVRGIRVGFLHPEILRVQLRAILRVKSKGKLGVMFPMVATIDEFRRAKAMLEEERLRLKAPPIEVGIMVEVPSVALSADVFAREADFFSVGTNDLTQYTLAMDRGHKSLSRQADALNPGVLKLIQLASDAAHRHGKWIGVCGGLASDLKAVPILLGLGIDELSVSIPTLPLVKSVVRETSLAESRRLAEQAVHASGAEEVRRREFQEAPCP